MDIDWDRITAVDLYTLMSSFVPKGGKLEYVKVYPSDYGLERMNKESTLGPEVYIHNLLEFFRSIIIEKIIYTFNMEA